jgi:hypothetical protein
MSNSTVFTIGSALRQAENDGVPVKLMVDGEWFDGEVAGLDGDGVLLESPDGEVVVRLTSISVVRLLRMAQEEQAAPVAPAPASVAAPAPTPVAAPAASRFADVVRISGFAETPEPPADVRPGPVGIVAAQLAAVATPVDEFDGLPDDVTEAERAALAERRALLAGLTQSNVDHDDHVDEVVDVEDEPESSPTLHLQPVSDEPEQIEPELVEPELVEPELVEPEQAYDEPEPVEEPEVHHEVDAEPTLEESPVMASTTQSDDWRAMLVSLRQEAQDAPHEPEKRRSPWRIAR